MGVVHCLRFQKHLQSCSFNLCPAGHVLARGGLINVRVTIKRNWGKRVLDERVLVERLRIVERLREPDVRLREPDVRLREPDERLREPDERLREPDERLRDFELLLRFSILLSSLSKFSTSNPSPLMASISGSMTSHSAFLLRLEPLLLVPLL